MKAFIFSFSVIIILLIKYDLNIYAEEIIKIDSKFNQIYKISLKEKITQSELEKSIIFLKDIEYRADYPVIENNETNYYGLTFAFGKIVEKNKSELAISSYLDYLFQHKNSAEEELSFSLERIFMTSPGLTLKLLNKKYKNDLNFFIKELAWGFVNNRYNSDPNNKLNSENYKTVFFSIGRVQFCSQFHHRIPSRLHQVYSIDQLMYLDLYTPYQKPNLLRIQLDNKISV